VRRIAHCGPDPFLCRGRRQCDGGAGLLLELVEARPSAGLTMDFLRNWRGHAGHAAITPISNAQLQRRSRCTSLKLQFPRGLASLVFGVRMIVATILTSSSLSHTSAARPNPELRT